jgi:RNA polymerase sigma factor (TIGR02999 family)
MPGAPQPKKDDSDPQPSHDHDLTALLIEATKGSPEAAALLVHKVYAELHHLAQKMMLRERHDHTLQPSALVNEAYLHLFNNTHSQINFQNRAHFFAIVAQQMRRILVDHARTRAARKRGGTQYRVTLTEAVAAIEDQAINVLLLDDLLKQLADLSPRQARVVELRYFAGLDCKEIAAILNVNERTVKRDWLMARSWLKVQLQK